MKAKYLWLTLTTLVFFGCDDNTGSLGLGMLPESDGITVKTTSFPFYTESELTGPVFAKTDIGYVGRFTDMEHGFGYYEGSFLTALNCIDSLTFPKPYDPISNRSGANMVSQDLEKSLVGAQIVLGYYEFFGDSLSPMQVSVYQLDEPLTKEDEDTYYTNIDPTKYVTKDILLAQKSFSAVDLTDSTRHEDGHLHTVVLPLKDLQLAKDIITENWLYPGKFKDSETFIEHIFKGIYITSEIGDGTVLYIKHAQLEIDYKGFVLDSLGDVLRKYDNSDDSTYVGRRLFASTMEVIQANNIEISSEVSEIVKDSEHTYLKSPAGIYTKALLPIKSFIEDNDLNLNTDTINAVKLAFNAYHHDIVNEFSMSPPTSVLLLRESELKTFFVENKIPNNTTSYAAYYSNNQYTFTNITRLVTTIIKEMQEAKKDASFNETDWLEKNATIAIVPVSLGTEATSSGGTSITNVQHDLKPTYVRLEGGKNGNPLQLQVTYSKFHE